MMQKNLICCFLVGMTFSKLLSQQNAGILQYLNNYKDLAISEMQRTGVPAAITLAQGIHETEAGKSDLVKRSNNHFGIKCKSNWTGGKVYHDDDARGECFRSYATADESYRDHSDFLLNNERYAFLFKLNPEDYEGWAYGLREAGYATNIKYSQLLIKLIKDYNLQEYTLAGIGNPTHNNSNKNDTEEVIAKEEGKNNGKIKVNDKPLTMEVVQYPEGEFEINKTKVIYAESGTSLLALATEYEIPLARLLDFNDLLRDETLLDQAQLIYLQRKRKTGVNVFHVMQAGETLYTVCQQEGIRMECLLKYNRLPAGVVIAEGEKIYLQEDAPVKPMLASEKRRF